MTQAASLPFSLSPPILTHTVRNGRVCVAYLSLSLSLSFSLSLIYLDPVAAIRLRTCVQPKDDGGGADQSCGGGGRAIRANGAKTRCFRHHVQALEVCLRRHLQGRHGRGTMSYMSYVLLSPTCPMIHTHTHTHMIHLICPRCGCIARKLTVHTHQLRPLPLTYNTGANGHSS